MKQKDKELLLKDICARLPFGVRVKSSRRRMPVTLSLDVMTDFRLGCSIKPYLRPMSSMTDEEKQVLELCNAFAESRSTELKVDFYNEHHLDYRGLIPKGLAIEVTEDNNPYKD